MRAIGRLTILKQVLDAGNRWERSELVIAVAFFDEWVEDQLPYRLVAFLNCLVEVLNGILIRGFRLIGSSFVLWLVSCILSDPARTSGLLTAVAEHRTWRTLDLCSSRCLVVSSCLPVIPLPFWWWLGPYYEFQAFTPDLELCVYR